MQLDITQWVSGTTVVVTDFLDKLWGILMSTTHRHGEGEAVIRPLYVKLISAKAAQSIINRDAISVRKNERAIFNSSIANLPLANVPLLLQPVAFIVFPILQLLSVEGGNGLAPVWPTVPIAPV